MRRLKKISMVFGMIILLAILHSHMCCADTIKLTTVVPQSNPKWTNVVVPLTYYDQYTGTWPNRLPYSADFFFVSGSPACASYYYGNNIPASAREILVFVAATVNIARGGDISFHIFTGNGPMLGQCEQILFVRYNVLNTYTSANMWFPVTTDKTIWVYYNGFGALNKDDTGSQFAIIGYR